MTGVDPESVSISYEMDEGGDVVSITLYLDDEDTAGTIVKALNNIDKGECNLCTLCTIKRVQMIENDEEFSGANSIHKMITSLLFVFIFVYQFTVTMY